MLEKPVVKLSIFPTCFLINYSNFAVLPDCQLVFDKIRIATGIGQTKVAIIDNMVNVVLRLLEKRKICIKWYIFRMHVSRSAQIWYQILILIIGLKDKLMFLILHIISCNKNIVNML